MVQRTRRADQNLRRQMGMDRIFEEISRAIDPYTRAAVIHRYFWTLDQYATHPKRRHWRFLRHSARKSWIRRCANRVVRFGESIEQEQSEPEQQSEEQSDSKTLRINQHLRR